jgi:SH3-like domain-containing protein
VVLANGLNFRLAPDPTAEQVKEQPQLQKETPLQILEAYGEWWRVRTKEGNEGWIRWRYVDPESGEEHIYASIYWESTG